MSALIAWLLSQFTSPLAAIMFIRQLIPMIKELKEIFEGCPKQVQKEAMVKAVQAAKEHCDGVGCATELK